MISLWIAIGTVEVCVLLFIVAAAVIAMAVRPGGKSPAETYFYAGELISGEETVAGLTITVNEDYRVTLVRHGLAGITGVDGAVSIAVTVTGTEIYVEERITPGRILSPEENKSESALFFIDCLPPNTRIHFRYNASASSRSASLTFTVKPDFNYSLPLTQ